MQLFKKFIELTKEKRAIEERLKIINGELSNLQDPILNEFQEQGVQSMNIDGMTMYIQSQLWAKRNPECPPELAIKALEEAHLEEYIKPSFNTQALSKHFREREENNEEIPPCLLGKIDIVRDYKVAARKS